MSGTVKAFAKELFGARYERAARALLADAIVFVSLRAAGFRLRIAPFVLWLMVGTLTAGAMARALASREQAGHIRHLLMLPFARRRFVLACLAALGAYAFLIQASGLLAVALAVSEQSGAVLWECVLCAANAALMTACIHVYRRRGLGLFWAAAALALMAALREHAALFPATLINLAVAALLLLRADAYALLPRSGGRGRVRGAHDGRCRLWRYLTRGFWAQTSTRMNTAALWAVACVLPAFLGRIEGLDVMPMGFALLTLNTPLCVVLSADPALERAVQSLPGQKRAFFVPYGLFIFLCTMTAEGIYLASWQVQNGGVTGWQALTAFWFAAQGAAGSALLERYCPICGWKTENDLWHHPRKLIVPAALLLAAVAIGSVPGIMLPALLTAEGAMAARLGKK